MSESVRTRVAPSPTGNLHVGTARTAIFNELFARQHGGQFIIRIEDTDTERSKPEFEANILQGLQWLGLAWDEGPDQGGTYGPYRQSERTESYQQAIEQLLASGAAYREEGSEAIKLKVEPGTITFTDLIRGEVSINTDTWGGDFVIARSTTSPVFHLAVVVDDAAMQISHVIRGEDHLTNTARHILIQRALSYNQPQYAHLPLLLDEERRKLSKRAGDVDLLAYQEKGYLPEAMLNYLALLGWNPGDDKEFFTHDQLIQAFSLEKVQKGGAIFSEEKLQAVNKHYLRQLQPKELFDQTKPFLQTAKYEILDTDYWTNALVLEQERTATLQDLAASVSFFATNWPADYEPTLLIWKKSDAAATQKLLEMTAAKLDHINDADFTKEHLEKTLLAWIDAEDLGRGDTLWPLRVALTGAQHSPGPFEVAAVLGKTLTLQRLKTALNKLTS